MVPSMPEAEAVFDGGTADCGSGLILLIRQQMLKVSAGGVLEIRSREPTVTTELPPWCRMVGHEHLSSHEGPAGHWRHFVRKGHDQGAENQQLEADKTAAKAYEWRLRGRYSHQQETALYARNFTWKLGQIASFDERDALPSAIEALLGSLLSELICAFAEDCSRQALIVDELEGNIRCSLNNALAMLGMETGDPSIQRIMLTVFVTSPALGDALRRSWEQAITRAPIYQTLRKACEIQTRFVIM